MSVPSLKQLVVGPLSRREALTYRLPLVTILAAGSLTLLGAGTVAGADKLTTDYGCATTTVEAGGTVIDAAREGALELSVIGDTQLEGVVTHAAQAAPGAGDVQPGQQVETCVQHNPLYGFGDSGWMAQVHLVQPPAPEGN